MGFLDELALVYERMLAEERYDNLAQRNGNIHVPEGFALQDQEPAGGSDG